MSAKRWVRFLGVLVVSALLAGCGGEPGEPNVIVMGVVKDAETGNPVAGARVADHLYAASTTRPNREAWTGTDGRYTMETWYEEHTLVASAPGYDPTLVTLTTKVVGGVAEVELNFTIHKKPQTPPEE